MASAGAGTTNTSLDGRYVYYHEDKQGNEIGHYVRVPFEGGVPEDISPELPPYTSYGVITSHQGNRLALSTATDEGIHIYCVDVQQNEHLETPRAIYHGKRAMLGFALSSTGEMLVLGSTEHSDRLRIFPLPGRFSPNSEKVGESAKII
jgi:hypothetical protein